MFSSHNWKDHKMLGFLRPVSKCSEVQMMKSLLVRMMKSLKPGCDSHSRCPRSAPGQVDPLPPPQPDTSGNISAVFISYAWRDSTDQHPDYTFPRHTYWLLFMAKQPTWPSQWWHFILFCCKCVWLYFDWSVYIVSTALGLQDRLYGCRDNSGKKELTLRRG